MFLTQFHLQDYLCKALTKFQNILVLDAAPFEHFSVVLKKMYWNQSMNRAIRTKESLWTMEPAMKTLRGNNGVLMHLRRLQEKKADFKPQMILLNRIY